MRPPKGKAAAVEMEAPGWLRGWVFPGMLWALGSVSAGLWLVDHDEGLKMLESVAVLEAGERFCDDLWSTDEEKVLEILDTLSRAMGSNDSCKMLLDAHPDVLARLVELVFEGSSGGEASGEVQMRAAKTIEGAAHLKREDDGSNMFHRSLVAKHGLHVDMIRVIKDPDTPFVAKKAAAYALASLAELPVRAERWRLRCSRAWGQPCMGRGGVR
jgi:hypothetical protein